MKGLVQSIFLHSFSPRENFSVFRVYFVYLLILHPITKSLFLIRKKIYQCKNNIATGFENQRVSCMEKRSKEVIFV